MHIHCYYKEVYCMVTKVTLMVTKITLMVTKVTLMVTKVTLMVTKVTLKLKEHKRGLGTTQGRRENEAAFATEQDLATTNVNFWANIH